MVPLSQRLVTLETGDWELDMRNESRAAESDDKRHYIFDQKLIIVNTTLSP